MFMAQNYSNHQRYVPGFHFLTSGLLLASIVLVVIYFVNYASKPIELLIGIIASLLIASVSLVGFYARTFALKAQDRAIRAEENLRHLILTGQPIDQRLTIAQIVALRFADNEEFVLLVQKAAQEGWSSKQIKQAIQSWKADHHRA